MKFNGFEGFLEQTRVKPIFGWITPSRKFIQSDMWNHFDVIEKYQEAMKLVPELKDWSKNILDKMMDVKTKQDEEDGEDTSDEFGAWTTGWHDYGSDDAEVEADYKSHLVNKLYQTGFIRVGTVSNAYGIPGDVMHFEGSPVGIKNLYQFCKDFAEEHGMSSKFEPRKY